MISSLLSLTFACATLVLVPVLHAQDSNGTSQEFDWTSLPSSNRLQWSACYDSSHECTNFEVPLNYSDPAGGNIVIPLIRIPAPVGPNSSDYHGPIIINPGGPGSSGIDSILSKGALITQVFGPTFDFVTFDPRGVGRSTPAVKIFSSAAEKALWQFSAPFSRNPRASPDAVKRQWAQAQILGKLAETNDDRGILPHITTDNVARDMLRIVEAYGQEKIQYWAASYGSTLGVVFASMFPDKIERMVLDGIPNIEAYYQADWPSFLTGADETLQTFFEGCHTAGKSACPFYASSPNKISENLDDLIQSVQDLPIPVYSPGSSLPYAAIWDSLSRPYSSFQGLAQGLADLANGNGMTIFEFAGYSTYYDITGINLTEFDHLEVSVAISCSDAVSINDLDAEDLENYLEKREASVSRMFAEIFMGITIRCSGWRAHPEGVFRGPFSGNTSHPILFVANTADPATPLANAVKRSKAFPGSIVLAQNTPGHTSLAATSPCLYQHVATYMITGTLPPAGTVCEVTDVLFPFTT